MLEFKGIEYFRKGTRLRTVNEDPTLLSFLLLFNRGSVEDSPLLTNKKGGAMDYLETVVNAGSANDGKGPGAKYAENLKNFQDLLFKINTEMPWFWESISGLEGTMQYKGMQDPFWGKDKKIDIECLEENVELMATTLMRLYRDACFDFERWVEVIPENLRRFSVDIYVTEVRNFQQKLTSRNVDLFGNSGNISDDKKINNGKLIAPEMSVTAKPFYHVQLGHCTFDIDSGNEMLAALSKNPEMKKPKISFLYQTVRTPSYQMGANLGVVEEVLIVPPKKTDTPNVYNPNADVNAPPPVKEDKKKFVPTKKTETPNVYGPNADVNAPSPVKKDKKKFGIKDTYKSKMAKLKDRAMGAINQVTNIADGLRLGGSLGNAHGSILGGPLANVADSVVENITGKLFLDNVYGTSTASTIAGAIQQGSINGLINAAGQLAENLSGGGSNSINIKKLPNIYGNLPAIDSSEDGNISPRQVYDQTAPDRDYLINDNVYGGPNADVDSTPDGNLNDNIYE